MHVLYGEEEATWRAYDVTDHRTTKTTTSKTKGGPFSAFLFYTTEQATTVYSVARRRLRRLAVKVYSSRSTVK